MATWRTVSGAKGYILDVSTSNSFSSYVDGYHGLDVGNVNGRAVTGLNPGTTYYYRVLPFTTSGAGSYSAAMTATTQPATGLTIEATFDSSITGDPNAAAIEAMINRAIAIYESLFSDPITIHILFRYSDTAPNGDPFPPGVLSQSFFAPYDIPWNSFISALRADATTSNDNTANASLPGSTFSTNIVPSSANGRALGLNTPPAMCADGTIGNCTIGNGPYDGIVTLNSAVPFSFSRPLISSTFDAQRAVEHEIDEVMGLGSYLNSVRTCPSYEAESVPPNFITGGAGIQSCPTCSGGADVGYVGNNSGTLQFNGVAANTTHSYVVTIWYTNGDTTARYALLSVNGSVGTPLSFPSTGSFQTLGSIQTTITLNAGSDNTLMFSNPIVGNWAPDFDRIVVNCGVPPSANLRPQDLFSWRSPGNRNLTSNGSRYFSIDSGSTNIVGFNQTPPGDFGDWLSEACPQRHPFVQNAFACANQFSDVAATSPEGINLDVIGYDLVSAPVANADILWQNTITGQRSIWVMNSSTFQYAVNLPTEPTDWSIAGAGDFNGDGKSDILWQNTVTGARGIWIMNGTTLQYVASLPTEPTDWSIAGTGDFNGDGKSDIVWQNTVTGARGIWIMNGTTLQYVASLPTEPTDWSIAGTGDFNGDGKSDIVWQNTVTGARGIWIMNGTTLQYVASLPTEPTDWSIAGTGDFNGDGKSDIVWQNTVTGARGIWIMNGTTLQYVASLPTEPTDWSIAGTGGTVP